MKLSSRQWRKICRYWKHTEGFLVAKDSNLFCTLLVVSWKHELSLVVHWVLFHCFSYEVSFWIATYLKYEVVYFFLNAGFSCTDRKRTLQIPRQILIHKTSLILFKLTNWKAMRTRGRSTKKQVLYLLSKWSDQIKHKAIPCEKMKMQQIS